MRISILPTLVLPPLVLSTLGLAACASYTSDVTTLQRGYPLLTAAVALYEATDKPPAAVVTAIGQAEAIAGPVVASLGSTQYPTTVAQALADIQLVIAAIPPASVSPRTAIALQSAEAVLALAGAITPALATP